jgi:RNase P/RNase MRP subunit p29
LACTDRWGLPEGFRGLPVGLSAVRVDRAGRPSGRADRVPGPDLSGRPSGRDVRVPGPDLSGRPSGRADRVPGPDLSGRPSGREVRVPGPDLSGRPSGRADRVPGPDLSGRPSARGRCTVKPFLSVPLVRPVRARLWSAAGFEPPDRAAWPRGAAAGFAPPIRVAGLAPFMASAFRTAAATSASKRLAPGPLSES